MSFSDWRALGAIIGLVGVVLLASYLAPWITRFVRGEVHGVTQGDHRADQQPTPSDTAARSQEQPPATEYKPECSKREDADLCAQMRMAEAAEQQEVISWLGLGLLAGTFIFTGGAAVFTGLTWHVMRHTAQRELRAYISLEPSVLKLDGLRPLDITIVAKNHGQTPAADVVHFSAVKFLPHPLPRGFDPGCPGDGISTEGIWPSAGRPFKRELGRTIPAALLAELQTGAKRLFVFSLIKYQDVFGRRRYTKLCASFDWRKLDTASFTVDEATGRREYTFEWEHDHNHNDFD